VDTKVVLQFSALRISQRVVFLDFLSVRSTWKSTFCGLSL